nr:MAG TPA: hypothetical protein [Caudoviricetes sp.]
MYDEKYKRAFKHLSNISSYTQCFLTEDVV